MFYDGYPDLWYNFMKYGNLNIEIYLKNFKIRKRLL